MKLSRNMLDTLDQIYCGDKSIKNYHASTLEALSKRGLITTQETVISLTKEGRQRYRSTSQTDQR